MKKPFALSLYLLCAAALAVSCNDDPDEGSGPEENDRREKAVFIVNEGNYGSSNSSLSYYVPSTGEFVEDAFGDANGVKLGDSANFMAIRGGKGYIVAGGSGVVMVIDSRTFEIVGQIPGLTNPREIHFLSDEKAYLTDLMSGNITIFNPKNYKITGNIETAGHSSTEQMLRQDDFLFVNCWSFDSKILVIDTRTDKVMDEIQVGIQPQSMVLDRFGKIWCLCDGGYEGNPAGFEPPSLWKIDSYNRAVEAAFVFPEGSSAKQVRTNGNGSTIYYILNGSVYALPADGEELPSEPLIQGGDGWFYNLGIDPDNGDVYVSDALDYSQPGRVYRFDSAGRKLETLKAGIIPGAFCFKPASK